MITPSRCRFPSAQNHFAQKRNDTTRESLDQGPFAPSARISGERFTGELAVREDTIRTICAIWHIQAILAAEDMIAR
jgi:hypothetical protein